MIRFRKFNDPVDAINYYLSEIHREAIKRKYNFDKNKIDWNFKKQKITVTSGQIEYELQHLKNKIFKRSPGYNIDDITKLHHPIFRIIPREIESWEIIKI